MQNKLNTQKIIGLNGSVLAHSEVTSARKSGALGTNTKSCSTVDLKDFLKSQDFEKRQTFRAFNLSLKERAGEILYNPKKTYKEQDRVCRCGKSRIHKEEPVGVKYNPDTGTASYTNIQYCSSAWACPDCSYKISQERKKELAEAMKACRDKGLHVAMLTLTVPHYANDDLKELLKKMSKAKHALWTNRNSKTYFAEQFPLRGHITATEVKYSDNNGFHPHFHILCFLDKEYADEDLKLIESELYDFWSQKCVKAGLGKPSREHGLHLKMGSNQENVLADYISKWGMADEMTQAHMKVGKKNMQSLTMWEVLELAQMEASTQDKYSRIFKIYAKSFKGRRQLFWSKGLKEILKVEVKEDEEIANSEEKTTESFDAIFLSSQDWWTICYYKKRAEILNLIELDFKEDGLSSDLRRTKDFINRLRYSNQNINKNSGADFLCA